MMLKQKLKNIHFQKLQGLIPVCVQDYNTLQVLMVGFMNEEALEQTLETSEVVFFSRSKGRLWKKGETSGHILQVRDIAVDCDNDSLLIFASPLGPTCHTGSESCFDNKDQMPPLYWFGVLYGIIQSRKTDPKQGYTGDLLKEGVKRIAQKVGEEGVEVALAALDASEAEFSGEVVDLLYHLFVLLAAKEISLDVIAKCISGRMTS